MSKREKQTSPQPEVPAPARLRQRTAAVPALQCGKVAPHSQLLLPCREPKQEPSQLFGMLCDCSADEGLGEGERAPGFLQSLYCRQQLTYIRRKQEQKVPVSTGCWAVAIRAAGGHWASAWLLPAWYTGLQSPGSSSSTALLTFLFFSSLVNSPTSLG